MKKTLLPFTFPLALISLLQVSLFPIPAHAAPVPLLKIEEPTDGQIIESYVVNLKYSLKNFTLKDYHSPLKNNPNQGHLLIWLDQDGRKIESAVKYYKDSPYDMADVSPGKHTLVVELVNNDSTRFDPPISQTIKFETKAPVGSEVAPVGASDQPLVAKTKSGEVPILKESGAGPAYFWYFIFGAILIILGLLGVFYLKKGPPPITPV